MAQIESVIADKISELIAPVLPWLSTFIISTFATAAQYAQKLRGGEPASGRSFLLDYVICLFVGLVTHLLCEYAKLDGVMRSLLVAISAHMGTRAMMQYEAFRDRVFGSLPVPQRRHDDEP
jgi:hypothetical protein